MMKNIFIVVILSVIAVSTVWSQQEQLVISGVVMEEGGALPGVTIYAKNRPGTGTTSDGNGKFSLKVNRGDAVVFSFIGYEEFLYFVDKSVSNLEIVLKESATSLEEIVVIGQGGTQAKATVTGALGTIDTQQLQVPATSMANILGGRMPGIITVQSSGEPGKNISEFWIRGIGTFGANDKALVLIDGLEGDLESIDPADIESFSILKDASATSVYGVRGANGVVLVTTKRGEEGRMQLSARANLTFSKLRRMPNYIRSYDYAMLVNEAYLVRGTQFARYSKRELDIIQYELDPDLYPDIDWANEIFSPTQLQQTYYLNARGGGNIARYFLSLNASDETAAYKTDPAITQSRKTGYNTYSFRTNLDINLTKTTKVYFSADGFLTRKTAPGGEDTDQLWYSLSQITPLLVPKKYSTGHIPAYGAGDDMSPYVQMNYLGTRVNNSNSYKTSLELRQDLSDIIKGLNIRVQGAFNSKTWYNDARTQRPEMYYANRRGVNGELMLIKRVEAQNAGFTYGQRQSRSYHFESTLNWSRIFEKKHRTAFLLYYYMNDSQDTSDIIGANASGNRSMSAIAKRYQGISSRLTYGFKDTYLFDFNFGYTGSENFERGRRFGFFPSISFGWVPTQYDFTKTQLPWLSFFKIRASYGQVGNDRLSGNQRFPYLTLVSENQSLGWGYTSGNLGGGGISETSIGANNLMWEVANKKNLGIDAQFLKDNLRFSIDFWEDNRDGIFQRRANIPLYAGLVSMPMGNVGKMKSWGSEANISYMHELSKKMDFTVRANYTYAINKVINWEQAPQPYPYQQLTAFPHQTIRGYVALGLFEDEQDVLSSPRQTFMNNVLPGDIKYKDVNGDGLINDDDRVPLSYPTYPRLNFGIGGEFRWYNFTVSILFRGTGNNTYYRVGQNITQFSNTTSNGMGYVPFHGGEVGNVLDIAADPRNRWIPMEYALANGIDPALAENPNALFPRLHFTRNANNSVLSTFWQSNKQYFRFQELMLSYKWRSKALNKVGIRNVDLQLVGNNLYKWDYVKIFDPEQAQYNGRAYPIPIRITFQTYIHF